ncbi:hypothetical protein AB0911_25570 [Streptomyces nigra]|uniref:hypothetical protein n=1 Tax=Streptomyces nigra TaxID=1827580 RepID=UPI003455953A
MRESVPWHEAADSTGNAAVTPVRDGMADEIRTFDAILDPARAQNLLTALNVMRADAARGARLDFALIQRWQQHVLAAPALPPLRSLPAFAKGGRERYGITPDTRARLDAYLAGSAKDTIRPLPLSSFSVATDRVTGWLPATHEAPVPLEEVFYVSTHRRGSLVGCLSCRTRPASRLGRVGHHAHRHP